MPTHGRVYQRQQGTGLPGLVKAIRSWTTSESNKRRRMQGSTPGKLRKSVVVDSGSRIRLWHVRNSVERKRRQPRKSVQSGYGNELSLSLSLLCVRACVCVCVYTCSLITFFPPSHSFPVPSLYSYTDFLRATCASPLLRAGGGRRSTPQEGAGA